MSSSYRISLDNWLRELDVKTTRVLDIGGAQLPVKGRTKSWDVKEYKIADLPNPHKDSPSPDIEIDMNGPRLHLARIKRFDLIFCLEVFDYIWSPRSAFWIIQDSLKPNGSAWVSFPSFYPLHQPIEDDALRYMPGGITKLAQSAHLKPVEWIARRPETDLLEQFYRAERMRAAKHEDHNFIGWIVRFEK